MSVCCSSAQIRRLTALAFLLIFTAVSDDVACAFHDEDAMVQASVQVNEQQLDDLREFSDLFHPVARHDDRSLPHMVGLFKSLVGSLKSQLLSHKEDTEVQAVTSTGVLLSASDGFLAGGEDAASVGDAVVQLALNATEEMNVLQGDIQTLLDTRNAASDNATIALTLEPKVETLSELASMLTATLHLDPSAFTSESATTDVFTNASIALAQASQVLESANNFAQRVNSTLRDVQSSIVLLTNRTADQLDDAADSLIASLDHVDNFLGGDLTLIEVKTSLDDSDPLIMRSWSRRNGRALIEMCLLLWGLHF